MPGCAEHEQAVLEADAALRAHLMSPTRLTDDGKAFIVSDDFWDELERLDAADKDARNTAFACQLDLIRHGPEPHH